MADKTYSIRKLDRFDALIATLSGMGAFAIYVRTLAPDILYGDSAEFQTLAYTLGHTHSTGYPIYLLLARLVGFLPINSPAWRISLFSALMAALVVAGVYLLARVLTNSWVGACLAAVGLALSYTLWSQAIVAEVYTAGAAFLAWALLLVLHWYQNPRSAFRTLFAAALLIALSLGVHATTALTAPVAAGFVLLRLLLWREANKLEWRRTFLAGASGAVVGTLLWLLIFLYIDWHNPPSSFFHTVLEPSRSIWNLYPTDMASPFQRIYLSINSVQWKDMLFEGGIDASLQSLREYLSGMIGREFSIWFLILGFYGLWVVLLRSRWEGGYLLATYLFILFYVLNYRVNDQYVFFLSTYILFAAAAGVGIGALIEGPTRWPWLVKCKLNIVAAVLVGLLLLAVVVTPAIPNRLPAIQTGVAGFVTEAYTFPVKNLKEPRRLAQMLLNQFPDNAFILMEWRDLYAVAYLAYVEGQKPDILLAEAMPYGNHGQIAASMIEIINQALAEGRPVYATQRFAGLEENFRLSLDSNGYVKIAPQK